MCLLDIPPKRMSSSPDTPVSSREPDDVTGMLMKSSSSSRQGTIKYVGCKWTRPGWLRWQNLAGGCGEIFIVAGWPTVLIEKGPQPNKWWRLGSSPPTSPTTFIAFARLQRRERFW
jgi:hypothetical protein